MKNKYAGIPAKERGNVRAIVQLKAITGEKQSPLSVYRDILRERDERAKKAADEQQRIQKENRRFKRESAKTEAQQALSMLLRAWWLAKGLEDGQEMEPALNEQDAAMFIRMAIKEAGAKLEDALVTFEVLSAAEADAFRE